MPLFLRKAIESLLVGVDDVSDEALVGRVVFGPELPTVVTRQQRRGQRAGLRSAEVHEELGALVRVQGDGARGVLQQFPVGLLRHKVLVEPTPD